jgi:hypothetical protein
MARIAIISCVSKKLSVPAIAEELYISPFFKYNHAYAKKEGVDKILILSAKYGVLECQTMIEPYNKTLNKMSDAEVREWASRVIEELKKKTNLEEDSFMILAGEKYRKYLLPHIKNYSMPLKGLGIGRQLKFLKERVNK